VQYLLFLRYVMHFGNQSIYSAYVSLLSLCCQCTLDVHCSDNVLLCLRRCTTCF